MKTLILTWNPSISKYRMDDFCRDFLVISDGETPDVSWNVGKNSNCQDGDRYIVIRQGMGSTGIVMVGYLSSDSYQDDENDKQGKVYKVNIEPLVCFHTDRGPHVTMKDLKETVPAIDWENIASGTEIEDEDAAKIEDLLLHFIYERHDVFDGVRAVTSWNFDLEDFESIPPSLQAYYKKNHGSKCACCGRDETDVTEMAYHFVLGEEPDYRTPFNKRLLCLCSECWFDADAKWRKLL